MRTQKCSNRVIDGVFHNIFMECHFMTPSIHNWLVGSGIIKYVLVRECSVSVLYGSVL